MYTNMLFGALKNVYQDLGTVVKSKLPPQMGSSLQAVKPYP